MGWRASDLVTHSESRPPGTVEQAIDHLTYPPAPVTLSNMVPEMERQDPERRRRRLKLLAELAGAKASRGRLQPRRTGMDRLRELIAYRRRRTE